MNKFFVAVISFIIGVGVGYFAYEYKDIYLINQANKELTQQPSSAGTNYSFQQFDGSQFKEAHAWLGNKIAIAYENQLLGDFDNYGQPPDETTVKQQLSKFAGVERLVLNIQSWAIITNDKVDPLANKHAEWYMQVLNWAREVLPDTNIGVYGMPGSVWNALGSPDVLMPEYIKGTNIIWPIMAASDSLYPSFDVPGVDVVRQQTMVQTLASVAKSLNKPFFPFMWHRGSGSTIQDKILPDTIIEQQCKFVRNNADGLVWWSGATETWGGGVWYPAATECFT